VAGIRPLLITSFALVALNAAGVGGATIVPQKGMAGVELGMTRAEVRARLGEPLAIRRRVSEIGGPYVEFRYPFRVSVYFWRPGNSVWDIRTTGPKERTVRGVGVGSTEAEVRRKVPRVRCETVVAGLRECHVGDLLPGKPVTSFRIRRGRVVLVEVGIVID
jgi:hypothetical protein